MINLDQLKTILWLRWTLTRNQWTRSRGLGAVIGVLVAIAMLLLAVLSLAGGFLGGLLGLRDAKPMMIMAVWLAVTLGFLFIWLIGLISELQRSETIDLQRLMHLPVALGQMFVINYVASLLTMGAFLFVPGMLGLAAGLTISRGAAMVLMIPLALSLVFMVSTWTYLLRGWLSSLMSNPRKRRAIIVGITFAFIVISQGPNLYFNVLARSGKRNRPNATSQAGNPNGGPINAGRDKLELFMATQKFVPPLWVPWGAVELANGHMLPALMGTLGSLTLGALGLRFAYRNTLNFYRGGNTKKLSSRPVQENLSREPAEAGTRGGRRLVELRLPGVPEQATALGAATLRSMLRAPEVKMAWGSNFLVSIIMAGSFLLRGPPNLPLIAKSFVATGAVVFPVFMMVQFFANQFGFDRDGFRALVLTPSPRKYILMGKNMAALPAGAAFGLVVLALISVWARLPISSVLAALFQLTSALLLAGTVGNLISIFAPYRIQPGSMKPTKMPALAMLAMVGCHLCFPLAMAPVFLPDLAELLWRVGGMPDLVPVNLILSAGIMGLVALLYWQTIEPFGNLLQRRETKILSIVTTEVE